MHVARRIGISQNYLSTIERGNVQIGSEVLLKMSREFGKIYGVAAYRKENELGHGKQLTEEGRFSGAARSSYHHGRKMA